MPRKLHRTERRPERVTNRRGLFRNPQRNVLSVVLGLTIMPVTGVYLLAECDRLHGTLADHAVWLLISQGLTISIVAYPVRARLNIDVLLSTHCMAAVASLVVGVIVLLSSFHHSDAVDALIQEAARNEMHASEWFVPSDSESIEFQYELPARVFLEGFWGEFVGERVSVDGLNRIPFASRARVYKKDRLSEEAIKCWSRSELPDTVIHRIPGRGGVDAWVSVGVIAPVDSPSVVCGDLAFPYFFPKNAGVATFVWRSGVSQWRACIGLLPPSLAEDLRRHRASSEKVWPFLVFFLLGQMGFVPFGASVGDSKRKR